MLPAKYRLRATKVDRLAIVDRPAVPDAQVVLFKRRNDTTESEKALVDFNREYIYRATMSAVGVLEEGFWRISYADIDVAEKRREWKSLFKSFKGVIKSTMDTISLEGKTEKADAEEPTVTDIVDSFVRGMKLTAISESFEYFKSQLGWAMWSLDSLPKGKQVISKVMDAFAEHITGLMEEVVTKNKGQVAVDKIGRIISSSRLAKLRQALRVLAEIVDEGEAYMGEKSRKEEDQMDIQEILKALGESELFKGIQTQLDTISGVLKEKGLLLTDDEKAKIEADTKAKAEADEKAKKEADEATEKAKTEADEKAKKDAEEAEKKAKELTEEKKKAEDEAKARLEKIEKGLEAVTKVIGDIGKRMGVKTSVNVDGAEKGEPAEDVFADALKR